MNYKVNPLFSKSKVQLHSNDFKLTAMRNQDHERVEKAVAYFKLSSSLEPFVVRQQEISLDLMSPSEQITRQIISISQFHNFG